MGYTTYFTGAFKCEPALTREQVAYLAEFNQTRRMKRDAELLKDAPDPIREAVGLPLGKDGGYFVGANGEWANQAKPNSPGWATIMGQAKTPDVIDYNSPPGDQPGLWCQWAPSEDGKTIEWDEGEKFYDYTDWLRYLIEHFLEPWGVKLNGICDWSGEEDGDLGRIVVKDNDVRVGNAVISYEFD